MSGRIVNLRPERFGGGTLFQLALPLLAGALGRVTGATWLYVLAALFVASIPPAIALAVLGAARTRVSALVAPPVTIAGRDVRCTIASSAPRPVAVTLVDRGVPVAAWWQLRGRAVGSVRLRPVARGRVESLMVEVRCSGPSGLWPIRCQRRITLAEPVLVGPQPELAAVPPAVHRDDEHISGAAARRGQAGDLHGVRPWADGDPVAWIHWPTTLRTGQLSVREWAPPQRTAVVVHAVPGPDGDVAAARAAGAVSSALEAGHDVELAVPEGGGWHVRAVGNQLDAAARLATAELGPRAVPAASGSIAAPDVERRLAPRLAVMAAIALSAGAVLGGAGWPPATTALTVAGLPVGVLVSRMAQRPRWVVPCSAVVALAAVLRFAASWSASTAQLAALRDPFGELVLVLVVVNGLDQPRRRHLRFTLAASAMLMLYTASFRIDPGYGWWVLGWIVACGWALASLATSQAAGSRTAGEPAAEQLRSARRDGRRLVGAARGALLTAGSGAAAVGLLGLLPVPEGPVPLLYPSATPIRLPIATPGGLTLPGGRGAAGDGADGSSTDGAATIGYFAFAERFDTATRGRPDDTVVMRVRAAAPDFWRGQTFARWDGRSWYVDAARGTFRSGPVVVVDRGARGDELVQTYNIARPMPNLLFAAQQAQRVYVDAGVWVRPDGALRADTTLEPGTVYTVVSRRRPVTEELLRLQGGPDSGPAAPRWRLADERYLQLPASTSPRTRALARQLTAPYPAVHDKVEAIEKWMAANVVYDLDAPVPSPGVDAVDDFLFGSRRGFCEQIATAMAVLLRSVGVPARVAAGYAPGRWDAFAGVWVVRASDAHTWTEVEYPVTGWQAYDPTASVPLAGDSARRSSIGGPIAAALGRAARAAAPLVAVIAAVAGATVVVIRVLLRRRTRRRRPAAPAQRSFERLVRRVGVSIDESDTNPSLAVRLAQARPDAERAAQQVASALDWAAFGGGDPAAAASALRELARALR